MFGLGIWDIVILVSIILVLLGVGIYFLNRWAGKRQAQQSDMVAQHKQTMSIYIIDKKKDKITNANFPKAITDQMPRMSKLMKMPLVKAKIGPQIMTLIADASVFDALPVKKTVTVELAGAYIVSMKGQKTKMEMEAMRKNRRKGASEAEAPKKWHENLLDRFRR
ncbi:MAG: hypothetical protein FWE05_00110 [Defluviitaleaceae bacterium]|nr:hypothetical protein [Defluviitaleaceae bacterium]